MNEIKDHYTTNPHNCEPDAFDGVPVDVEPVQHPEEMILVHRGSLKAIDGVLVSMLDLIRTYTEKDNGCY